MKVGTSPPVGTATLTATGRRRVVVTGASGGIGSAVARRFLGAGAVVANLDMRAPPARLGIDSADFHTVIADIADETAVLDAFTAIDGLFGGAPPDVLVHCAAISVAAPFLDIEADTFERIVAVNVRGMFLCCRAAGRRMRAAGAGHIVAITSVVAEQGWAGELPYGVTKGAQKAMVQAMAVELAPFGVYVNAVGPGPIEQKSASMAATRDDEQVLQHDLDRTPLGRFGAADEIAEAVYFLAGSTWTTGQTLYVDGGFLSAGLGYFGTARERLQRG